MIPALDEVIGGLAEGAMTVFTGKPGNGKSTLAGQLLLNAIEQGHSVCAYSGELTKEKFQEWINLQAAGSEYIGLKYDPVRDIRVPCIPYAVQERLLDYYRDRFYLFDNQEIFEANQSESILSGSLPDIDTNVANEEIFWEAQADVLGEWRSAPMIAYGTLRRLSAWKMYCRANDVPYETANSIAEQLKRFENDLRYAEEDEREAINVHDYVPREYHALIDMSEKYLGVIDSISPHPCAHLLCQNDIRREIGIIRINSKGTKKRTVYAAFIDGATAEAFGYLKNDILHVDVVKVNREAFERAGLAQPTVGELLRLTANDRETWRMYADGLTLGINQVEQPKTREKVLQYKPRTITELSSFVAAVRPAFKSMLPIFLERRHFDYGIPALDRLVQTREMASSFIIFQEQIMKILQSAGFTAPDSYAAIKAISKKKAEKVLKLKEQFTEGFTRLTGDPAATEKVWTIINDATSYLFNASHAVCVALDSLYGAYLKAHYPLEFYTALLSNYAQKGDKDRIS